MVYVSGIRLLLLLLYATGTATKSLVQGAPMVVLKSPKLQNVSHTEILNTYHESQSKPLPLRYVSRRKGIGDVGDVVQKAVTSEQNRLEHSVMRGRLPILMDKVSRTNMALMNGDAVVLGDEEEVIQLINDALSRGGGSGIHLLPALDGNYKSHHPTVTELITETSQPISIIPRLHQSSPSAPSLPEPRLTLAIPTSPHALQSGDLPTKNAGKFSRHGRRIKRSHLSVLSKIVAEMHNYALVPVKSREGKTLYILVRNPMFIANKKKMNHTAESVSSGRRQPTTNSVPPVPMVLPKPPLLKNGPPIQGNVEGPMSIDVPTQDNPGARDPLVDPVARTVPVADTTQQQQQMNMDVLRTGEMSKKSAVKRTIVPPFAAQTKTSHRAAQRTVSARKVVTTTQQTPVSETEPPTMPTTPEEYEYEELGYTTTRASPGGPGGSNVTESPRGRDAAGWAGTTTESALGPLDRINTTDVPEEIEARPDKTPAELARDLAELNPGRVVKNKPKLQDKTMSPRNAQKTNILAAPKSVGPQQTARKPPAITTKLSGKNADLMVLTRENGGRKGRGGARRLGVRGGKGGRKRGQSGRSRDSKQRRTTTEAPEPAASRYERWVENMENMEVGEASWFPAWMSPWLWKSRSRLLWAWRQWRSLLS